MAKLRLGTYNSSGLAYDKRKVIANIADVSDVVFLQEHWLHKGDLIELDDLHADFTGTGVSGMPASKLHTVGRPYGGSGILYRKSLSHLVQHKSVNVKNVTAIQLGEMLVINVYLPGDNYRVSDASTEFREVVDQLENYIATQNPRLLLVGGDLNTSLLRNNAHTKYLQGFANRLNLFFTETHNLATYEFTYQQRMKNGSVRQSTVDNFLVCEDIYRVISKIECKQTIDNASYHIPLLLEFSFDVEHTTSDDIPGPIRANSPSIAWHKVTENHTKVYQRILYNKLSFKQLPNALTCTDVFCTCPTHRDEIDNYCKFIVDACLNAANESMPKNGKKSGKPKSTPYWNEEVGLKREEALEAQWIWEATGRPNSGSIYDEMRGTRRRYHYAVRCIKKDEVRLRNRRMAEAMAEKRDCDIWKETRRANGGKKPSNIGGLFNDQDIANMFAENNRDVYNSVPSDVNELSRLCAVINDRLKSNDYLTHKCSVASVRRSVDRTKVRKSDGDAGLMSDHVKHAPHIMSVHLCLLFNAIICHGYMPIIMLRGSITHIPKDPSKMLCDSCNYRGICLCIVFSKIFEDLFVYLYADIFDTSGLQFAYKKKVSTNVATLTLKELLRYYRLRSTRVFGCALDASKAFDRVRHDKLFDILLHRGLPPIMLRVLVDMYGRQVSRCIYFSAQSEYYGICNGTRQGGVASPILFILYMDVLYSRLKDSGFGLHVGSLYYGVIGYADDLLLLASSMCVLQQMINICAEFGNEYDVAYNPTKSKVIVFDCKRKTEDVGKNLVLNGGEIKFVKELEYLGNVIRGDLSEYSDVEEKVSDLNASTNSVCHRFGSASYNVKCKLFFSLCCHAYGTETWDLTDMACNAYWAACKQAVRRVMGLPPSCPSVIVDTLSGIPNGQKIVLRKAESIINCFKMSDNVYVSAMYAQSMSDSRSMIRKNLDVIAQIKREHVVLNDVSPDCLAIKELLEVRDGNSSILDLTEEEVDMFVMMFSLR